MDDLMSLDWNAPAAKPNSQPQPHPQSHSRPAPTSTPSFPSLNPSPLPSLSRGSTPLSTQLSGAAPATTFRGLKTPSKPSTPANDSFSSLLGSKSTKTTDKLSLQERQQQLQEEKENKRKQLESQFGAPDNAFWDSLGSGRSTPNATAGAPIPAPQQSTLSSTINKPFAAINAPVDRVSPAALQDEDDILAAFNAAAPVDASSHYPVPHAAASRGGTPSQLTRLDSNGFVSQASSRPALGGDDDDDPFGLNQMPSRPPVQQSQPEIGQDDDILGDLGKPVSELPHRQTERQHRELEHNGDSANAASPNSDPVDAAVAELVEMGFPADKSAEALAHTDSGTDIQAAVGWLLNQAHDQAKQKSRQGDRGRASPLDAETDRHRSSSGRNNRHEHTGESVPAWMREQGSRSSSQRRNEDRLSTEEKEERDVAQLAQEFGSTFLKSANSFWKQSQKKVQKAVAEFQQDGDPSQPKWMRDAQSHAPGDSQARRNQLRAEKQATDEALMLESDMGRPQKPGRTNRAPHPDLDKPDPTSRGQSPASAHGSHRSTPPPRFAQDARQQSRGPVGKLTRDVVEEQSAQAYVSPARRKKTTPKPSNPGPESDPFSPSSQNAPSSARSPPLHPNNPFAPKASAAPTPAPKPASSPLPARPKAPPRQIPSASATALSTSTSHRQTGTDAFKRGDYAAAHTAYTSALQPLPLGHPITIIILCNRALTNIKVGDPKAAVADADSALSTIGPTRGEGEKIAMGGVEGEKEMKDFFGKALMRKAEALEHMEKWNEAAKVWKEAVEAGLGGSVSIQGRNRCEKAAGGGSQQPAAARPGAAAKKPAAARPPPRPTVSAATSAEAVKKLREANAAAEKADDEKFALTDQVDATLIAWKGSKSDNLRALLGSLDTVLWPEAGWKKVGMQDLVMPNKVKIVYMKAIAKVHPDKVSAFTHEAQAWSGES